MNVQNNINFTGLYYKNNCGLINSKTLEEASKNLEKLADIYTGKKAIIDRFEKEFQTNLFLSKDMDIVSFSHERYGKLNRYGMEDIPVSELTAKNRSVVTKLKKVVTKATNDWIRMDYRGLLGG